MITLESKGDWKKTTKFLNAIGLVKLEDRLHKYGNRGMGALSASTPVDSAETAVSWSYEIVETAGSIRIIWKNSNVSKDGTPIAIYIQYGHGTKNGGWVEGRDFINPAIQPIFDQMVNDIWKEVERS
jgi:hypothetical protein